MSRLPLTHHVPDLRSRRPRAAYTLVEILLVVVILSILAAVAVQVFRTESENANVAAMANLVRSVQRRIDVHHAENSAYPATLDEDWFQGRLVSTRHPTHANPVWTSADPAKFYPTTKVLTNASPSTLWYSPFHGRFYARVPAQGNDALTLALFNQVNGTALTSLDQTESQTQMGGGVDMGMPTGNL